MNRLLTLTHDRPDVAIRDRPIRPILEVRLTHEVGFAIHHETLYIHYHQYRPFRLEVPKLRQF
ncbi:MAG: hypothetical protein HC795_10960 [Coleofasciculaceae cyanobacterium RL_1_1]|nr:hypothetical protein [Coleofasciculaceae cyanobacterium RL_1_1]